MELFLFFQIIIAPNERKLEINQSFQIKLSDWENKRNLLLNNFSFIQLVYLKKFSFKSRKLMSFILIYYIVLFKKIIKFQIM